MLSDSSEDEDDLPLPGTGSSRAASILQKYLPGSGSAAAASPAPAPSAAAAPTPTLVAEAKAGLYDPTGVAGTQAHGRAWPVQPRAPLVQAPPVQAPPVSVYSATAEHSQLNGALGVGVVKGPEAGGGAAMPDDMEMSPVLDHEKSDSMDAKALAKLPAQVILSASIVITAD